MKHYLIIQGFLISIFHYDEYYSLNKAVCRIINRMIINRKEDFSVAREGLLNWGILELSDALGKWPHGG